MSDPEPPGRRARMLTKARIDRRLGPTPATFDEHDRCDVSDAAVAIRYSDHAPPFSASEDEGNDGARVIVTIAGTPPQCVERVLERLPRLANETDGLLHEGLDGRNKPRRVGVRAS
jgi:hypothetical protein